VKAGLTVAECYLRLGLVRTFFGFPTVLNTGIFCQTRAFQKTGDLDKLHTVVGPRNLTSSWSPHSAQQRMSGKEKSKVKV